jgi:hypothetical protein
MKTSIRRSVPLVLALALVAGSVLATAVDAGSKPTRQREKPRITAPDRSNDRGGPGNRDQRGDRGQPGNRDRRGDRDQRGDRGRPGPPDHRGDRRHHGGSGVGSFLGGVAIGAILGGHPHHWCAPPPPPPQVYRIYVYDCDWCRWQFRDYDDWVEHLIDYHGVPGYDIDRYYPPYARGHWEVRRY